jgi:hypothetical protein
MLLSLYTINFAFMAVLNLYHKLFHKFLCFILHTTNLQIKFQKILLNTNSFKLGFVNYNFNMKINRFVINFNTNMIIIINSNNTHNFTFIIRN